MIGWQRKGFHADVCFHACPPFPGSDKRERKKPDNAGACIRVITDAVGTIGKKKPPGKQHRGGRKRGTCRPEHHQICRFSCTAQRDIVQPRLGRPARPTSERTPGRPCLSFFFVFPWPAGSALSPCHRKGTELRSRPRRPNRLFWVWLYVVRPGTMVHSLTVAASKPRARPLHRGRNFDCLVALEFGHVGGTTSRRGPQSYAHLRSSVLARVQFHK